MSQLIKNVDIDLSPEHLIKTKSFLISLLILILCLFLSQMKLIIWLSLVFWSSDQTFGSRIGLLINNGEAIFPSEVKIATTRFVIPVKNDTLFGVHLMALDYTSELLNSKLFNDSNMLSSLPLMNQGIRNHIHICMSLINEYLAMFQHINHEVPKLRTINSQEIDVQALFPALEMELLSIFNTYLEEQKENTIDVAAIAAAGDHANPSKHTMIQNSLFDLQRYLADYCYALTQLTNLIKQVRRGEILSDTAHIFKQQLITDYKDQDQDILKMSTIHYRSDTAEIEFALQYEVMIKQETLISYFQVPLHGYRLAADFYSQNRASGVFEMKCQGHRCAKIHSDCSMHLNNGSLSHIISYCEFIPSTKNFDILDQGILVYSNHSEDLNAFLTKQNISVHQYPSLIKTFGCFKLDDEGIKTEGCHQFPNQVIHSLYANHQLAGLFAESFLRLISEHIINWPLTIAITIMATATLLCLLTTKCVWKRITGNTGIYTPVSTNNIILRSRSNSNNNRVPRRARRI